MSNAKFIKIDNLCDSYTCNICSENIENDKIIALKCNPSKHIFCYDCILDWYVQLNKKKNPGNYTLRNMCPICRKYGGLLPLYENTKYLKGVHVFNYALEFGAIKYESNCESKCGAKLKTKDGFCTLYGNKKLYNGLCKKHFSLPICQPIGPGLIQGPDLGLGLVPIQGPGQIDDVNPNKKAHECGVKFKTKNGYCESIGKKMYDGKCGVHKPKISNSIIESINNLSDNLSNLNDDSVLIV